MLFDKCGGRVHNNFVKVNGFAIPPKTVSRNSKLADRGDVRVCGTLLGQANQTNALYASVKPAIWYSKHELDIECGARGRGHVDHDRSWCHQVIAPQHATRKPAHPSRHVACRCARCDRFGVAGHDRGTSLDKGSHCLQPSIVALCQASGSVWCCCISSACSWARLSFLRALTYGVRRYSQSPYAWKHWQSSPA